MLLTNNQPLENAVQIKRTPGPGAPPSPFRKMCEPRPGLLFIWTQNALNRHLYLKRTKEPIAALLLYINAILAICPSYMKVLRYLPILAVCVLDVVTVV